MNETSELRLIDFGDLGQLEYDERPPFAWFAVHDGFTGSAQLPLSDLDALIRALLTLRRQLKRVPAVAAPYCMRCGRRMQSAAVQA